MCCEGYWYNIYKRWAGSVVYKLAPDVWRWWANRDSDINIHMKLSEVRYMSSPKNAREVFDMYEQFFNEYEDPEVGPIGVGDNITVIERDYSETISANYASIYLWVRGVDNEDKAKYIIKEFVERVGLPYTDILLNRHGVHSGSRYYATVYYKEEIITN